MSQYTQRLIKPAASVIAQNRSDIQTLSLLAFPASKLGAHSIVFNFSKYSYDKNASLQNKNISGSIMLPVPDNMLDATNVRVNQAELGLGGSAAARFGAEVAQEGRAFNAVDMGVAFGAEFLSMFGDGGMAVKLLETLPDEDRKGFEAGAGVAVNPHLALAFEGIDLKTHNFSWTLAPSNAQESADLRKIINTFKRNALPSFSNMGQNVFNYPNVVDIFFMGTDPGYLYYFKRSLISTFDVNYAPTGGPAFVEGGRPAVVGISMTLMEMDIHTSEDYTDYQEY